MEKFYAIWAILRGKNSGNTPKGVIVDQMNERRALPTGMQEFHEWADRIISGALLSADVESQKYSLANMLLHLGPTESYKEDAFFIHSLRKFAVNQIADAVRKDIHEQVKSRLAVEEAAKATEEAAKIAEQEAIAQATLERANKVTSICAVTPSTTSVAADAKVLGN